MNITPMNSRPLIRALKGWIRRVLVTALGDAPSRRGPTRRHGWHDRMPHDSLCASEGLVGRGAFAGVEHTGKWRDLPEFAGVLAGVEYA